MQLRRDEEEEQERKCSRALLTLASLCMLKRLVPPIRQLTTTATRRLIHRSARSNQLIWPTMSTESPSTVYEATDGEGGAAPVTGGSHGEYKCMVKFWTGRRGPGSDDGGEGALPTVWF